MDIWSVDMKLESLSTLGVCGKKEDRKKKEKISLITQVLASHETQTAGR